VTAATLGVRMVRYSFPVPLFHRRSHAGLSRRTPTLRSGPFSLSGTQDQKCGRLHKTLDTSSIAKIASPHPAATLFGLSRSSRHFSVELGVTRLVHVALPTTSLPRHQRRVRRRLRNVGAASLRTVRSAAGGSPSGIAQASTNHIDVCRNH
jgi:hypothetical protein